jgi:hypothetical protein
LVSRPTRTTPSFIDVAIAVLRQQQPVDGLLHFGQMRPDSLE